MNSSWQHEVHPFVFLNQSTITGLHRLLVLASLCFGAGCAGVKVVRHAEGFDSIGLNTGKLAIGAVTGMGGGEYFLAENVSKALTESLAVERPGLQVIPLAQIQAQLPETAYKTFVHDFSELPEVRPQEFEMLHKVRSSARYVLLVNVSSDDTLEDESRSETVHYRQVRNEKTGKYESEPDYTEYRTSRTAFRVITATFVICDLDTCQSVWVATGRSDKWSSNSSSSSSWTAPAPNWPGAPLSIGPLRTLVERVARKLPAE